MQNVLSDYLNKGLEIFYFKEKNTAEKSQHKLNVLIPCLEKDSVILPLLIQDVRTKNRHRINKISVVAPYSDDLAEICEEEDCEFISHQAKKPVTEKDIKLLALKHIRQSALQ